MNYKWLIVVSAVTLASASGAKADILVNGGFEEGGGSFNGWTTSFNGGTNPVVIQYGQASGYPTGAFGEAVPAPINGGTYGAYFSTDTGTDTISQKITLTPGNYTFSFDVYAPNNGLANPYNATFGATLGNDTLVGSTSAQSLKAGNWYYLFTGFTVTASETVPLSLSFNFEGLGGNNNPPYAADVVVDNFSITADNGQTSAVPEPSTWAMLLLGFGGIGFMAWRRKSKPALMAA